MTEHTTASGTVTITNSTASLIISTITITGIDAMDSWKPPVASYANRNSEHGVWSGPSARWRRTRKKPPSFITWAVSTLSRANRKKQSIASKRRRHAGTGRSAGRKPGFSTHPSSLPGATQVACRSVPCPIGRSLGSGRKKSTSCTRILLEDCTARPK